MTSLNARQAADRLDNAYATFASDNGDGVSSYDWNGAYEAREDGYQLGEEAFALHPDDREDFIEAGVDSFADHARYLVACAAEFRIAELSNASRQPAVVGGEVARCPA